MPALLITPQQAQERLTQAERLWLFLDYDGTLADFAPTPDDILPDPELIDILTQLKSSSKIRLAIISGRRLDHIRALMPVEGILLAGTYGIELLMPDGRLVERLDRKNIRPTLDRIKPFWHELIADKQGYYLEDKSWSMALHARYAQDIEAESVMNAARDLVANSLDRDIFRILGGHKFLEVAPRLANKGLSIANILDAYPWDRATPVYIGDDDKDEEAFAVINQRNGIAIVVAAQDRESQASLRLRSPSEVCRLLMDLVI